MYNVAYKSIVFNKIELTHHDNSYKPLQSKNIMNLNPNTKDGIFFLALSMGIFGTGTIMGQSGKLGYMLTLYIFSFIILLFSLLELFNGFVLNFSRVEEKTEFELFREFIKDKRRGFPRWEYHDIDKKFVDSQFKILLREKFFLEMDPVISDGTKHRNFILGPPLLSLISSWETEELSRKIHSLTKYLLIIALGALIITGIQIII